MYHVPLTLQCVYVNSDERDENGVGERVEILWSLVYRILRFVCQVREDLRAMVRHFVEVCRRNREINADKSKVMGAEWRGGIGVCGTCE